jgi:intein-encoded DNA endonuclease-like protein
MRLANAGLGPRDIAIRIRRRFKTNIDPSQVRDWADGKTSPYGRVHRLNLRPSPELAYVIGSRLGDATQSKSSWHHNYMVKLLVRDKDFADEFSRCASVILGCKSFNVWWYEKRKAWNTTVNSIMLYHFLGNSLDRFKQYIEHCDSCVSAFLHFCISQGLLRR